ATARRKLHRGVVAVVPPFWIIGHEPLESTNHRQTKDGALEQAPHTNPSPSHHQEYRVELDVFNGPLDLLLYLIKRDELDVVDIPIARITDTYMRYVEMLRSLSGDGLDINVAGDFLVMA